MTRRSIVSALFERNTTVGRSYLRRIIKFLFIIAVLCLSVAVILAGRKEYSIANVLLYIAMTIGIIIGIVCWFKGRNCYIGNEVFQIMIINLILAIFWDLGLVHNTNENINWFSYWIGFIAIHLNLLCWIFELIKLKEYVCIYRYLIQKKIILAIIIGISVFIFSTINIVNVWDLTAYESTLSEIKGFGYSMNTFSLFDLCGHVAWGYVLIVGIGEFIIPINGIGAQIIHIFMGMITLNCFDDIVRMLFPYAKKMERSLYVIAFGVSPLFLGLNHYISLDYGVLCFLVWMVCFHLKKQYILQFFCTFLLCFSKETGVAVCFTYFFSYYLWKAYIGKEKRLCAFLFSGSIGEAFRVVFPALLFCLYTLVGKGKTWAPPAGGPKTGFFSEYRHILSKLETILLGNFGWCFLLVILLGAIWTLIYRNKRHNIKDSYILVLSGCFLGYTVFNFCFVTYNHFRYNQAYVFLYTILLIYSIQFYKEKGRIVIFSVLSFFLFIENFITIDPVMFMVFPKQNVEISPLITTRREYEFPEYNVSDSIVYNYQYQYYFKCLNKFFDKIGYNGTQLILFPNINQLDTSNSYVLLGNSQKEDRFYYVPGLKMLCTYDNDLPYERSYLESKGVPVHLAFVDAVHTDYQYQEVYYIEPYLGYDTKLEFSYKEKEEIRFLTTRIQYYKIK